MKKNIRGCISCILPCGALDVIRIIHSNARVEEITTCTIKAADVMRAHPNHVLKNLSSPNLLIVSPHADLRRGNIYFLVPIPPPPNQHAAATYQKLSTPTHTSTTRPCQYGNKERKSQQQSSILQKVGYHFRGFYN
ncbi:hypothetical protein Ahy_A04g018308 [Arachis hypogaea]|uniref:Uncharacterized protein n=1 Tax=Arachis hypogaea TaxID=3818 RepID=A0A445DDG3_ARAHY|nr:hypothetical protein Ahy_A04g018308 [Arachis hypogaea]